MLADFYPPVGLSIFVILVSQLLSEDQLSWPVARKELTAFALSTLLLGRPCLLPCGKQRNFPLFLSLSPASLSFSLFLHISCQRMLLACSGHWFILAPALEDFHIEIEPSPYHRARTHRDPCTKLHVYMCTAISRRLHYRSQSPAAGAKKTSLGPFHSAPRNPHHRTFHAKLLFKPSNHILFP